MQNDVLLMDVDTVGGQVRRVELLKHREESNRKDSGNLLMLSSDPGRVFLAQTGLVGAEGLPNHNAPMTVISQAADPAAPPGTSDLVMAAEGGGARLERRYRLLPGSYQVEVETRVANLSDKPLAPTLANCTPASAAPAPDSYQARCAPWPMITSSPGRV